MRWACVLLLLFPVVLTLFSCSESKKSHADLVLVNGQMWTVNPKQPWASAVAIEKNTIIALGSQKDIEPYILEKTEVVDLKGAFVLPGFIDCHTHFLEGGFSLDSIELKEAGSKEAFIRRIKEKADAIKEGEWILNGNWDHQQFESPLLPRKEWIDPVTRNNPVCVNRHDGHMVLLNSLALKMCGISNATSDPPGGEIVRDPQNGEPTGILIDAAIRLAEKHIPAPSFEEKVNACRAALEHARACGVTSVHDMAYSSHFEVYQKLLEQDELTACVRVYVQIPQVDDIDLKEFKQWESNSLLVFGGLKGFVDGSLGSSSALFFDPYTENPDRSGLLHAHMFPEGIMKERLLKAEKLRLQVAVHAIGDKANHMILDIFQEIFDFSEARDRRWRIEHAQHLIAEDIGRFGQLGIIASVQPFHAIDDGRWAEKMIGEERILFAYPFLSLAEKGALLAFGSDWTVAPLDPIQGIYAAVTRRTLDGQNPEGWIPGEKISLVDAIKGYTINAAYSEFSEQLKGSLEIGKKADLVVLDRNLFEIPPEEISRARVQMTVFDGRIIFQKGRKKSRDSEESNS